MGRGLLPLLLRLRLRPSPLAGPAPPAPGRRPCVRVPRPTSVSTVQVQRQNITCSLEASQGPARLQSQPPGESRTHSLGFSISTATWSCCSSRETEAQRWEMMRPQRPQAKPEGNLPAFRMPHEFFLSSQGLRERRWLGRRPPVPQSPPLGDPRYQRASGDTRGTAEPQPKCRASAHLRRQLGVALVTATSGRHRKSAKSLVGRRVRPHGGGETQSVPRGTRRHPGGFESAPRVARGLGWASWMPSPASPTRPRAGTDSSDTELMTNGESSISPHLLPFSGCPQHTA
ncbi:peroxisomal membrane protein 11A isoform X3 [Neofelis nebulosa]|uniref:peroxisomal membrane protein 11A isoform X3 n=1 Tax=Neofelis nebulosa TaxID=61452 RepID=UPI00272C6C73|nr:peroxisomal membrane protein 11A isoform X3 [Neofelis nebulosa]